MVLYIYIYIKVCNVDRYKVKKKWVDIETL